MNQLSISSPAIAAKARFKSGDKVWCYPSINHVESKWEYSGTVKTATYDNGNFVNAIVQVNSIRSEKDVIVIISRETWLRHRYA